MKINAIQLKNTQHFSDLKIDFQTTTHSVTVILGDQASGKTTIIKNIYQALTWFSARFKDLRSAGVVMLDQEVMQQRNQSKIEISIEIPSEIGVLPESSTAASQVQNQCQWQLYKTLSASGIGISRVETAQLEQCVGLYLRAYKNDPLQGLPLIAYYPTERFIHEVNLLSKNNPSVFQHHAAYENAAIPLTTFARFFEWLREVSDIENAQASQLYQQLMANEPSTVDELVEDIARHQAQSNQAPQFPDALMQIRTQQMLPYLTALKSSLSTVIPEISDLFIEYQPKLQLMVCYKNQICGFQQLSSSIRTWVALVGDVVRRLCLLNPMSLYPCQEGDGILMIDQIDLGLDPDHVAVILKRLQRAFPQLQIIATGQSLELMDNDDEYQYLKLSNKTLQPMQCQKLWQHYDHVYSGMRPNHSAEAQQSDSMSEQSKAQVIFEQIQQLNEVEQHELQRLIQADDDPSHQVSSC
ncbi:putative ATP-binding protein involved in virulence [Acinetobacter calcoaceticus]|uniref:Putative ATP-binding protein involved in virulence n=1 Tax=Acinetobacter calcoaceticus TaxID=471 RepID=A0A4R1XZ67_ACICA|nr:putative ATP-binding protein involved in virulence [Acinetobacter calcoaceticus]